MVSIQTDMESSFFQINVLPNTKRPQHNFEEMNSFLILAKCIIIIIYSENEMYTDFIAIKFQRTVLPIYSN